VREGSQAGTAKGDSGVAVEGRAQDRSIQGVVVMGNPARGSESGRARIQPACEHGATGPQPTKRLLQTLYASERDVARAVPAIG
jgi:hypothetical protein